MSDCAVCGDAGVVLANVEPIHGGNIYERVEACAACAMGDYWRAEFALVRHPPPCEICGQPAAYRLSSAPRCAACDWNDT